MFIRNVELLGAVRGFRQPQLMALKEKAVQVKPTGGWKHSAEGKSQHDSQAHACVYRAPFEGFALEFSC